MNTSNNVHSNAPRDPRGDAPVVGMDLLRPTTAIERDLRLQFPTRSFWWELETDEKSGWVYTSSSHVLAKLVHVAGPDKSRTDKVEVRARKLAEEVLSTPIRQGLPTLANWQAITIWARSLLEAMDETVDAPASLSEGP